MALPEEYKKLTEEPHISVVLTTQQLDILKREGVRFTVGPKGGIIAQRGGDALPAAGRSPLIAAYRLGVL